MHQQNIIFVFLQVLKLVMEITVKVKDIIRMEVRYVDTLKFCFDLIKLLCLFFCLFYVFKIK